MFHTLTLHGGPHAKNLVVYLDGHQLKGVTGVQLHCDASDVIRVTLDLIVKLEAQVGTASIDLPPLDSLPPHLQQVHADIAALIEAQP